MAGAVGLREVRYGYEGDNHLGAEPRTSPTPISPSIPSKCIVCSRCVRACEEVQGTFALTIDGPRLRLQVVSPGMERAVPRVRMRLLRRLRPGLPDGDADGEVGHRDRPARAFGGHHLRLLRRRLLVQGRDEGRRGRAHGALQGRQGQSRPFLRQGPLRLGLRHPPGPHPQADDPRRRSPIPGARSSWEEAIAHVASEFRRIQDEIRPRRHRRHHLVALHQRGDLPGPEAGARRLRQQQRRHLRPRLPFADRLRPEDDLRHLGRHAGLRLGRTEPTSSW